MIIDICNINEPQSVKNVSVADYESEVYELAREEQVFSSNELAKFAIASELHLQGLTVEAISRILSIPQEELFAEFDS